MFELQECTLYTLPRYTFLEKLVLLLIKDALNWSKATVNTFIMLQKDIHMLLSIH